MRLLNHQFKWPATAIFYVTLIIGIYAISVENQLEELWEVPVYSFFGNKTGFLGMGKSGWIQNGIFNEVLTFLIVSSGLIAGFSKEKIEDELTSKIRLESLAIAIIINYILVLMGNFLLFDFSFLTAMMVFIFTPLVMFNLIFQFRLFNYYRINQ